MTLHGFAQTMLGARLGGSKLGRCCTFREEAAHCLATLGGASHSCHVDQHLRGAAEGQAADLQHNQDGAVSRDP